MDKLIIEAELIMETDSAYHLDCEGDKAWFPKSQVKFNPIENELEAPVWLLREKFPNENF